MKTFFIPGLGPGQEFYTPLLSILPELRFIPLPNFSYTDVTAYMEKRVQKKEKILLCGWSLGAVYALRWALENRENTASLFLTGSTACFCSKEGYNKGVAPQNLTKLMQLAEKGSIEAVKEFYSSALSDIPQHEDTILRLLETPPSLPCFLKGLQEWADTDLLDKLPGLRIPVDIVQGIKDPITPLAGAKAVAERLPACRLEELPGGHCLFREQPEQFNSLLIKFIERNRHDW